MIEKDRIPKTPYIIYQDRSRFSFGVDAILLSSFARIRRGECGMDIGANTGILSFRVHALYQPRKIYAVELDQPSFELLEKGIELNRLEDTVIPVHADVRRLEPLEPLDFIITNPPYMPYSRGIHNKDERGLMARTEKFLKLEEIFLLAKRQLRDGGKLTLIHRPERLVDLMEMGRKHKMEPKRLQFVYSKPESTPKMILMEFVKNGGRFLINEKPFILYENGAHTKELLKLYEEPKG